MVKLKDCRTVLSEAYIGSKPLEKAEKHLAQLMKEIREDHTKYPENLKSGKDFQNEIQKVFGFNSFYIMWHKLISPYGPCTPITSRVMCANWEYYADVRRNKGIYDKEHRLDAIVIVPVDLIYSTDITVKEMMAVIIHEVGHNFDYSPFGIVQDLYQVLILFICQQFIAIGYGMLVPKRIQKWIMTIGVSLPDMLLKLFPPITSALVAFKDFMSPLLQIVGPGVIVLGSTLQLSSAVVAAPLLYVQNIFSRKAEEYADSFATMYGYGPYLTTGIDKVLSWMTGGNVVNNKPNTNVLHNILADIAQCEHDMIEVLCGDHASNQQRLIKNIAMIERDLKEGNYPPGAKKEIQEYLNEMKMVHASVQKVSPTRMNVFTSTFRKFVASWYNTGNPIGDFFIDKFANNVKTKK